MSEEGNVNSSCSLSSNTRRKGNTEDLLIATRPHSAQLASKESYNGNLSLPEREQKWGFTLAELQSATKVVSRLFQDPSLFVGDPYLLDSRLYTMITRDRKTKRSNREVYKAIMSEERSRRKRYERRKDAEAISRTGMKRERIEALNLLTRSDADNVCSPLLLCAEGSADDGFAESAGSEIEESCEPSTLDVSSPVNGEYPQVKALTPAEITHLRLIGAFENLLRLQQVFRGETIDRLLNSTNLPKDTFARSPLTNKTSDRLGGDRSVLSGTTLTNNSEPHPSAAQVSYKEADSCAAFTPRGGRGRGGNTAPTTYLTTGSSGSAEARLEGVDWVAATQLTAQVYRYLPPAFGSQMPPALFPGPMPWGLSQREQSNFISGLKLVIANRLLPRNDTKDGASRPELPPTAIHASELVQFLRSSNGQDIVLHQVSDPMVLSGVESLRDLVASSELDPSTFQGSHLRVNGSICVDTEGLLDAIESAITEGDGEVRGQSALQTSVTFPSFPSQSLADQTLNLLIARRLYRSEKLVSFGSSPIVIERNAPTSESEEPDTWSIFDNIQQYASAQHDNLKLSRWRSCSTCKIRFKSLHPYYYSMCHLCGEFNYNKRLLARDLRGKVVLLTGCRIKIGYAMALSLLRCGATVLGTTRFPHEAVARFQQETDYEVWKDRLKLFPLDLRDLWLVTQFCGFVRQRYRKLFAIINNAAQTIARTSEYTAHLRQIELNPSPQLRQVIELDRNSREWLNFFLTHSTVTMGKSVTIEPHPCKRPYLSLTASSEETGGASRMEVSSRQRAELVNARSRNGLIMPSKASLSSGVVSNRTLIFDRYDTQAEESDDRETNSWVMKLAEVQGSEAAEVMTINALAPFILNSKLKPCLMNREHESASSSTHLEARFIINVSAMEGQFYRFKQTTHPHTNMAKAALNMMTRTSAEDYARDGIYMNSVDTGWITDESPKIQRERRSEFFDLCPLDEVDAAARCLDLIYTNSPLYGMFFKDYREIPW